MPDHSDEWYKERGLSLDLPQYMIDALERGLRLHEEGKSGDGLSPNAVRWATKGAEEGEWSAQKWVDCDAWFARHNADFGDGKAPFDRDDPGAGEVAWFLWGDNGDGQGPSDAARITKTCGRKKAFEVHERIKEMDAEDKARSSNVSTADLDPNPFLMSLLAGNHWCMSDGAFGNLSVAALYGGAELSPHLFGMTASAARLLAADTHCGDLWESDEPEFDEYWDPHLRESGVGVLPVRGLLFTRSFYGMCGYDRLIAAGWAMVADPRCSVIVMPIGSPGGMATGIWRMCDAIRKWREVKPVITIADDMVCSAAEAIASQGSLTFTNRDAERGHLGNWVAHDDMSAMFRAIGIDRKYYFRGANKVFFADDIPRSESTDTVLNASADYLYDMLCEIVALGRTYDGRTMTADQVKATDAMIYHGAQAIDIGLADRAETDDGMITYHDLIVQLES